MNRILNVQLLPELADPQDRSGHCAVIIDVLRASTTITTAIASTADGVIPCLTVEDARTMASRIPGTLLGGERGGKRLPGFDLGNSPEEYSPQRVAGRPIVFTTTNGTKAMSHCKEARRIVIGAIVNRMAICRAVCDEPRVDLVCAGTEGAISMDDAMAAGAIVAGLTGMGSERQLNDSAKLCLALWRNADNHDPSTEQIVAKLSQSVGGENLIQLGMQSDIQLAARLDVLDRVPVLDPDSWRIS